MPISCDPDDLAQAAADFRGLSPQLLYQIKTELLCQWVNSEPPVDPE